MDDVANTTNTTMMENKEEEEEEEAGNNDVQLQDHSDIGGNSGEKEEEVAGEEGKGGSRIMRAMERILRESPSNVLRCGK